MQTRRANGIPPPIHSGPGTYLERVRYTLIDLDCRIGLVSDWRISALRRTRYSLDTGGKVVEPYAVEVVNWTMLAAECVHEATAEDAADVRDGGRLPELDMPHLAFGQVRRIDRPKFLS